MESKTRAKLIAGGLVALVAGIGGSSALSESNARAYREFQERQEVIRVSEIKKELAGISESIPGIGKAEILDYLYDNPKIYEQYRELRKESKTITENDSFREAEKKSGGSSGGYLLFVPLVLGGAISFLTGAVYSRNKKS